MLQVREILRINPTDKNESYKFREKCLYINGVALKNVKDILTNGYPKDRKSLYNFDPILDKPSTDLYNLNLDVSYCEVDNTVKKLSFVFVVCSEDQYKDTKLKEMKVIEDSRGSITREGWFGNDENRIKESGCDLIPAYLIIFEFDEQ